MYESDEEWILKSIVRTNERCSEVAICDKVLFKSIKNVRNWNLFNNQKLSFDDDRLFCAKLDNSNDNKSECIYVLKDTSYSFDNNAEKNYLHLHGFRVRALKCFWPNTFLLRFLSVMDPDHLHTMSSVRDYNVHD